ncbi:T3SS effector HopA1 family protein [Arthrobacter sp. NIO-1057]|uniref:T3SS effector HopA1 family protein n=1 Tax=Arthrobacter sp. NIO-1057 TaxID=993071 RepID=UPI00071DD141|nr:T3SS effector HopA1 family protein [Arthrobacter sp. NIO-1057]KSU66200.1 hypothetical protein AS038_11095 [Arthrobacter sp. NIO-1057]
MNAMLTATGFDFAGVLDSVAGSVRLDLANLSATIDDNRYTASSPAELKNELSTQIYQRLHIRNPLIDAQPTTAEQDLATQLISLVPHQSIWQEADPGFESTGFVDGETRVVAKIGGVKVLLPESDVRRSARNSVLSVRLPSWRTRTTPGYLLVLGERSPAGPSGIARLYVGCDTPAQALGLFPKLLRALAASGSGYHLKALSSSLAYPRSDAIVAYIPVAQAAEIAAMFSTTMADLPDMQNSPSIFTQPLGRSIALAEEGIDQRASHRSLSFGQHRSRVLADALFRAERERICLHQAWAQEAAEARIDPNRPSTNLQGAPLATHPQ